MNVMYVGLSVAEMLGDSGKILWTRVDRAGKLEGYQILVSPQVRRQWMDMDGVLG